MLLSSFSVSNLHRPQTKQAWQSSSDLEWQAPQQLDKTTTIVSSRRPAPRLLVDGEGRICNISGHHGRLLLHRHRQEASTTLRLLLHQRSWNCRAVHVDLPSTGLELQPPRLHPHPSSPSASLETSTHSLPGLLRRSTVPASGPSRPQGAHDTSMSGSETSWIRHLSQVAIGARAAHRASWTAVGSVGRKLHCSSSQAHSLEKFCKTITLPRTPPSSFRSSTATTVSARTHRFSLAGRSLRSFVHPHAVQGCWMSDRPVCCPTQQGGAERAEFLEPSVCKPGSQPHLASTSIGSRHDGRFFFSSGCSLRSRQCSTLSSLLRSRTTSSYHREGDACSRGSNFLLRSSCGKQDNFNHNRLINSFSSHQQIRVIYNNHSLSASAALRGSSQAQRLFDSAMGPFGVQSSRRTIALRPQRHLLLASQRPRVARLSLRPAHHRLVCPSSTRDRRPLRHEVGLPSATFRRCLLETMVNVQRQRALVSLSPSSALASRFATSPLGIHLPRASNLPSVAARTFLAFSSPTTSQDYAPVGAHDLPPHLPAMDPRHGPVFSPTPTLDSCISSSSTSTSLLRSLPPSVAATFSSLLSSSVSASSMKSYLSVFALFAEFCAANQLPTLPSTPQAVLSWLASLFERSPPLAPSTIRTYYAAIRSIHRHAMVPLPDIPFEFFKRTTRGYEQAYFNHMQQHPEELAPLRQPLPTHIIIELLRYCWTAAVETDPVLFRAALAIILAFVSFGRASSLIRLRFDDVLFSSSSCLRISFRHIKANRIPHPHIIYFLSHPDHPDHPDHQVLISVRKWQLFWFSSQPSQDQSLPFFSIPDLPSFSSASPSATLTNWIHIALQALQLPPNFSSHSCRKGGAASAVRAGMSIPIARARGHWMCELVMLDKYLTLSEPASCFDHDLWKNTIESGSFYLAN